MKSSRSISSFSPLEIQKFVMPVSLAAILVLAGMVGDALYFPTYSSIYLVIFGISGILYIISYNIFLARFNNTKNSHEIVNSLVTGIGMGYLYLILPNSLTEVLHILIIFCTTAIATISERRYAYISLFVMLAISLPKNISALTSSASTLEYFVPFFVSVVVLEAVTNFKNIAKQHIHRLETINIVSHQIMQSLDTKQTLSLLDAAIRDALEADTFFIGILDGDQIKLELFYDGGKYYNGTQIPTKGTLSGWVIKHQKELFLPDIRDDVHLDGVDHFVFGNNKTSLSWVGIPLKSENITGVLALASYTANAFDRADLELLANLGQHITLTLDNTIRHAQVEKQARLDSLTGVYNHGYFLESLAEQVDQSIAANTPLSLIMLDIDYFKQYNDTYGHLVGDRVLQGLCVAVQQHIKHTDSVGRWGGEEFVISLPGADGNQAIQVAKRISETLGKLRVEDSNQNPVPAPTISQGIAVCPKEADEIYRLIDIADKRLYTAKERGRNQIEPDKAFWENN